MTLRRLHLMAVGRQQESRGIVVAQAALIFSQATVEQINEFIRSGYFEGGSNEEQRIPYNPDALKRLVDSGRLR